MWRTSLFAVALVGVFSAAPAHADRLRAEVASYNRIGKTITLTDKSVVHYSASTTGISDNTELSPGDVIEIEFAGAEGDMSNIRSIIVVTPPK